MKTENIIGYVHLCGMVLENIYGFATGCFVNGSMDTVYMVSFVAIPFSWLVCKDECIISYYVKRQTNPQYVLGDSPENADDLEVIFPNRFVYVWFYNLNHLLRLGSVWIVNQRTTQISCCILCPTLVLYSYYVFDISWKWNSRYVFYPYFHSLLCFYLFFMIYEIVF